MSKELEMLRKEIAEAGRPLASFCVVKPDDLRRILARLEAAERVCESCEEGKAPWSGNYEMMYDKDALRAYRALDTKEPT